jgi:hypothetical protein
MERDRQLVHFQVFAVSQRFATKSLQLLSDSQECALYVACGKAFSVRRAYYCRTFRCLHPCGRLHCVLHNGTHGSRCEAGHGLERMRGVPENAYAAFDFFVTADHSVDWLLSDWNLTVVSRQVWPGRISCYRGSRGLFSPHHERIHVSVIVWSKQGYPYVYMLQGM